MISFEQLRLENESKPTAGEMYYFFKYKLNKDEKFSFSL